MARYAAGDAAAFELLYQRYRTRAHAYFLRRTGEPDRARDLSQQLFLRLHCGRGRYDPERPFDSWFFEIARRIAVDDLRRICRSREVPLGDLDAWDGGPSCEERVSQREALEEVLGGLSREERHVLVAAKIGGVRYDELAVELDRRPASVRKLASRAIARIRQRNGLPGPPRRRAATPPSAGVTGVRGHTLP